MNLNRVPWVHCRRGWGTTMGCVGREGHDSGTKAASAILHFLGTCGSRWHLGRLLLCHHHTGQVPEPVSEAGEQRRSGRWRARSSKHRGSMQAEVRSSWDGGGAGDRRGGRASRGLVGCSFGALWEWVGLAGGEQECRSLGTLYKEATRSSFSPFVSSLLPLSIHAGVPVVPPQLAL